MKRTVVVLMAAVFTLAACNKSPAPAGAKSSASTAKADAFQQRLLEYSGNPATDCGRLDVHAAADQLNTASSCAMQAAQTKRAFYVAYDMPGMSVGVAGNADGKLFSVQSQDAVPAPALTSGACPSQLRVASSGRVTCFAPGEMGSMGGGHGGAAAAPGMSNPHAPSAPNPHTAVPKTQ